MEFEYKSALASILTAASVRAWQLKTGFKTKKNNTIFLQINWNINPEIFRIGGFALRYYSKMFAMAFHFSYLVLSKIYIKENVSINRENKLVIFVFIGTLAGARLGHTLFYEFGYYKHHLLEMILPFRIASYLPPPYKSFTASAS